MIGIMVLSTLASKFSDEARADLEKLLAPRFFRYSLMMAIVALVDGAMLFAYIDFLAPRSEAVGSLGDPFIGFGALLGLLGLLIFTWFQESTVKKTKDMSVQMAQSRAKAGEISVELIALQKRSVKGAKIGLVILFLVIVLMVIGTNVS